MSSKNPAYSELRQLPDVRSQYAEVPSNQASKDYILTAAQEGLGVPVYKKRVEWIDLLAVIVSIICFAIGVIIVQPGSAAWHLQYNGQIIVFGLLLSIQTLCLRRLSPIAFAIIEARYGQSHLQNYEAIFRGQVLASHVQTAWRTAILVLVLLPIGLSTIYKRNVYRGGTSSRTTKMDNMTCAVVGPPEVSSGNGILQLVNATTPFQSVSNDDRMQPPLAGLPRAYGFNMLLLSNTSAALLDAPMPDRVLSMQQALPIGTSLEVTIPVNATVVSYNNSVESHRDDDDFWEFFADGELLQQPMYNGYNTLLLAEELGTLNDSWCFAGVAVAGDDGSTQVSDFQSVALYFNLLRKRCTGTWTVTKTAIELSSGSCSESPLSDQTSLTNHMLAPGKFFMPVLEQYIAPFLPDDNKTARQHSPWKLPVYTTTIASMYWARHTALGGLQQNYTQTVEVTVFNPTMKPEWSLYVVLAIQPLLAIAMFVLVVATYKTPISQTFGMIAILAGVDRKSLDKLHGASMSGKLETPISLQIKVYEPEAESNDARVEYVVGGRRTRDRLSLWGKRGRGIMERSQRFV